MRFVADIHLHSRFSRATSRDLNPQSLYQWANLKGITVVGTGDFTHPVWLQELKDTLEPAEEGLYRLRQEHRDEVDGQIPASCHGDVRFMLTVEISTIYKKRDRTRKVHHVVAMPDFDAVDRLNQKLGNIGNLASSESQAAMAFQALKYGIAQTVSIELASGLDTHDDAWATDQVTNQSIGFTALATLVDDLSAEPHPEGGTFMDRTTIVCFSEFGRTPTLNNRDGRDHSLSSSAMLIGAGVPHNKVVGASSDSGMNPRAIDPMSGEPTEAGGTTLSPTLIMASVMESAGLSTDKLRVNGLPCLMG